MSSIRGIVVGWPDVGDGVLRACIVDDSEAQ